MNKEEKQKKINKLFNIFTIVHCILCITLMIIGLSISSCKHYKLKADNTIGSWWTLREQLQIYFDNDIDNFSAVNIMGYDTIEIEYNGFIYYTSYIDTIRTRYYYDTGTLEIYYYYIFTNRETGQNTSYEVLVYQGSYNPNTYVFETGGWNTSIQPTEEGTYKFNIIYLSSSTTFIDEFLIANNGITGIAVIPQNPSAYELIIDIADVIPHTLSKLLYFDVFGVALIALLGTFFLVLLVIKIIKRVV